MLENLAKNLKKEDQKKPASEVGRVVSLSPFAIEINGAVYSSKNFAIYVPAIDRIKQYSEIPVIGNARAEVEIGDLELEPDSYARPFLVGDLVDVTDRGSSFVVHGRLVRL